ncbi:hypothetical protein GQ43DRAFT_437285 [Delitschia confertaspora ATCC 74209]|uniref:Small ribosomal subunit protein uS10m n=1 Tax=Delitschia confertaspora ATCC 74209 TaxID=1513339 RepID=A0A9P4JVK4_9PLEO|nr:hypothetical protein GQ43DRAFT_437285 [Delitschia confertaspora ATCC 74209]
MSVPRCSASVLRTAKRLRISNPRPFLQTFSRCESSDTKTPSRENAVPSTVENNFKVEKPSIEARPVVETAPVADTKASPVGKNRDELLKQLQELEIEDAEEFATLWKSQEEANARMEKMQPKTKQEAQELWAKLKEEPDHFAMLHMYKRAGVEPIKLAKERGITLPGGEKPTLDPQTQKALDALRSPPNIRAIHLRPLRRTAPHGIPVCDLQLRTYSIRNLQLFADFAMRAAYYLGLAAKGPIPLPRITERWTVPRSNFIFKKSQENFERITMRRLIQIQDGDVGVVKVWLAFLQKHQFHGVGMKANVWEYESLEEALSVGKEVEERDYEERREGPMLKKIEEILGQQGYKEAMKGFKSPAEIRA